MIEKLEERKEKEKRHIEHGDGQRVPDQDLFRQLGNKVKVIKHGN